jgi:hypothetical protein
MAAKNVLRRAMLYGTQYSVLSPNYPILTNNHSPRLLPTLP